MEIGMRIQRNFLEAIRVGRVTEHDRSAWMTYEGGSSEDVTPLFEWARDNELIVDGWHPQHRDDWHFVSLNDAGERRLTDLKDKLNAF